MSTILEVLKTRSDVRSEEDTKQVLVVPMLNMLGYDTGFRTKIHYEYYVNAGKNGKKVDIALPRYLKEKILSETFFPKIFVEVKPKGTDLLCHYDQLENYLNVTPYPVLGVLTNGLEYCFFHNRFSYYSPFFEIDFHSTNDQKLHVFIELLKEKTSYKEIIQYVIKLIHSNSNNNYIITITDNYGVSSLSKDLSNKIKHYAEEIGISPLLLIKDMLNQKFN